MHKPRDGDLYKSIEIEGTRFDIYYGYETEGERERWDPSPVYPWFPDRPQYTKEGIPFVLAYQDVCSHYGPIVIKTDFNECANCRQFDKREDFIGLCKCPHNRVRKNE